MLVLTRMEGYCKAEDVLVGRVPTSSGWLIRPHHPKNVYRRGLGIATIRRLRQWTPRQQNSPTLSKLLLALAVFGTLLLLLLLLLSAEDLINAALLSNSAKPLTVELPV